MQNAEKVSQNLKKQRFYGIIQMFLQGTAELYSATMGVLPFLVKIKFKGKDLRMVDYLYYKKDYRGAVFCEKNEFERFEIRARLYINSVINSRVEDAGESAYYCICAVAEQLYKEEGRNNLKAESLDGYSVTYAGGADKQMYAILRMCLPSELLFKGVR